ncbi:MAG: MBOAT family protein [Lachnospiraceae bacterium]|nr:MBOAT family protein [Lachnospiraceae bacterium]
MVFSSIPFLFFFLPLCMILYYAVPFSKKKFSLKNGILLIFSLVFYAWGEPRYIKLIIFATLVDYINGLLMERFGNTKGKRTFFLCCSITVNLLVLCFYKYADFLVNSINGIFDISLPTLGVKLPVGISFFTFQTMSYIIDLYRGETKAEHNYFDYLTYVSMFPQLVAGPIVRFADINAELHKRTITFAAFENGLFRFMQGLFKKVLIANQIGALWEELRVLEAAEISVVAAWIGALAFTLQLYFDFSAYSDMAIGMGEMLGFHFNENFNYPLSSVSVTDFWRRWHISLSTWFRDYIYIPLGGNRVGVPRHLLNMFIVWFLTGLWHGASWNFVLWGLYYGVLLALEKYVWGKKLAKLPSICQHLYAILIVVFGFVIFTFENAGEMASYISSMFAAAGNPFFTADCLWYVGNYGVVLLVACILAFPVYPWLKKKIQFLGNGAGNALSVVSMLGYVALFAMTVACLVSDTYNPFLYFRF